MLKYGVVGAIALAVLVAATWDGAKSKKKDEVAKADVKADAETAVTGDVGATTHPAAPVADAKPQPPGGPSTPEPKVEVKPPAPVEDVLEKYQVHKGDTIKAIARTWLGDENLAPELYEYNKARIPDLKHLNARLTLVFPRSKFAISKKTGEEHASAPSSPSSGSVPAGMKKDEVKATDVPASSPASEKKYVVKEGDTLYGISARELGKGGRWREIQKLNGLGSETLKKGQTIVLPSK